MNDHISIPQNDEITLGEYSWKMIHTDCSRLHDNANYLKSVGYPILKGMHVNPVHATYVRKHDKETVSFADKCYKMLFSIVGERYVEYNEVVTRRRIEIIASTSNSPLLAIAFPSDIIYFYDIIKEEYTNISIQHEYIQKISCLKFNPMNNSMLAIGCSNGVFIASEYESNSESIFLRCLSPCKSVLSLSFSQNGLFLAVIYEGEKDIYLYNTQTFDFSLLHLTHKVQPQDCSFSSFSDILCVTTISNELYFFNIMNNTSSFYSLSNIISTYTWSGDGRCLYFNVIDSPLIYIYYLKQTQDSNIFGFISQTYIDLTDMHPFCTNIYQISVDPTNSRMTCIYKKHDDDLYGNLYMINFKVNNYTNLVKLGYIKPSIQDTTVLSSSYLKYRNDCSILCSILHSGDVIFTKQAF